jgi:hypothetical protein
MRETLSFEQTMRHRNSVAGEEVPFQFLRGATSDLLQWQVLTQNRPSARAQHSCYSDLKGAEEDPEQQRDLDAKPQGLTYVLL